MIALLLAASFPANLVIIYGESQPTVVRYPTWERCEAARKLLIAQAERREPSRQVLPSGVIAIRRGIQAYCIPA